MSILTIPNWIHLKNQIHLAHEISTKAPTFYNTFDDFAPSTDQTRAGRANGFLARVCCPVVGTGDKREILLHLSHSTFDQWISSLGTLTGSSAPHPDTSTAPHHSYCAAMTSRKTRGLVVDFSAERGGWNNDFSL